MGYSVGVSCVFKDFSLLHLVTNAKCIEFIQPNKNIPFSGLRATTVLSDLRTVVFSPRSFLALASSLCLKRSSGVPIFFSFLSCAAFLSCALRLCSAVSTVFLATCLVLDDHPLFGLLGFFIVSILLQTVAIYT